VVFTSSYFTKRLVTLHVSTLFLLGSLSKSLRLALLRLPLLKRSGESTSRQSTKLKFKFKQSEIQSSWVKELELKISFLLFNFSKPNGFVQRKIAVICFARTNRIFLNESVCRTLCTMTTI